MTKGTITGGVRVRLDKNVQTYGTDERWRDRVFVDVGKGCLIHSPDSHERSLENLQK